jgi:hypothetical protein
MEVEFTNEIYGDPKGKALFTLTFIDEDDAEDTSVQLWRANDHDHLQELFIKDSTSDDDSPNDDYIVSRIEEDWDFKILPKQIATFK